MSVALVTREVSYVQTNFATSENLLFNIVKTVRRVANKSVTSWQEVCCDDTTQQTQLF